jgi:hypothetical protein
MARLIGSLILLAFVSFSAAQETTVPPAADDAAAPDAPAAAADTAAEDTAASDPDLSDDPDLDEQTYEEDEDVFVPTEEIPSDEPIPFPTNI